MSDNNNDEYDSKYDVEVATMLVEGLTFVSIPELVVFLGTAYEGILEETGLPEDSPEMETVGALIASLMETLLESHELTLMLAPDMADFIDTDKMDEYAKLLDRIKDK